MAHFDEPISVPGLDRCAQEQVQIIGQIRTGCCLPSLNRI